MGAYRQLSHDAQVKVQALRIKSRTALAEQQALLSAQMKSYIEAIMQEVQREWESNRGEFELQIEELTQALNKARTDNNVLENQIITTALAAREADPHSRGGPASTQPPRSQTPLLQQHQQQQQQHQQQQQQQQ